MKPRDDYRNGDEGSEGSRPASASGSESGSGGEGAEALSLRDAGAPARALAALNALRKSRQHFDVVLLADGAEVAAHRAVLAAASPYLLEALQPAAAAHRVERVDADSLRALVEYAYTGRLRVRDAAHARRLYRAAWRLRVEPARAHLAAALLRRAAPADALELRALPDLAPEQLRQLDEYIAANFEEICSCGALAALPVISIEMLRESSAEDGEETPVAVAEAALHWLRERQPADVDLEELCARTHLLFVDSRGELRDCGELPAAVDEAPEVGDYRREAAQRDQATRRRDAKDAKESRNAAAAGVEPAGSLGGRVSRGAAGDWCVLAARGGGGGGGGGGAGGTRALVVARGRLAAARVTWRAGGAVARGGVLGGTREAAGERRAPMSVARCALGAAVMDGKLVVCGGYDRARVLKTAEAYDPEANAWSPLPDMRCARARFPAARVGDALYVLGGSDGHAELDSVDALMNGAWRKRARLPLPRSHAAAAASPDGGDLYVLGGWAGGLGLRRVDKYSPAEDAWTEAPPLIHGRSQCAGVLWEGALWALGGCDTWHCLSSTETLALAVGVGVGVGAGVGAGAAWALGPALPTARRSVGGCGWRGRLVSAGGSDGAASLRRVDWLLPGEPAWRNGPDLRRPRAALALAVLGGALYAAGGFDGKQFLSCVECLYAPDGEWTALCAPSAPASPLPAPAPASAPAAAPAANGTHDEQQQ